MTITVSTPRAVTYTSVIVMPYSSPAIGPKGQMGKLIKMPSNAKVNKNE